jgi:regulator of nonsense transcripts 3
VTEALLETAFGAFGAVTKVEIDKKKGFGYVDFADPESLQKAMAASPVTVAQSQVVVLERKANPGGEKSRKGRGEPQQQQSPAPPPSSGNAGNTGNATASSARGSRGGRGSRNKGSKGGAAGGNGEKEKEKTEKGSSGK